MKKEFLNIEGVLVNREAVATVRRGKKVIDIVFIGGFSQRIKPINDERAESIMNLLQSGQS